MTLFLEVLATGEKSDATSQHVDAKNNIIETESLKINYGPFYWASQPPPYLPSYRIIQMMWKEKRRNLVRHLENWEWHCGTESREQSRLFSPRDQGDEGLYRGEGGAAGFRKAMGGIS